MRLLLVARRDWADVAIQADALPLRAFRDWLWLSLHLDDDRESIRATSRRAARLRRPCLDWKHLRAGGAPCGSAFEKLRDRLVQATRAYPPAPDAEPKLKALEEDELPAWLRSVAEVAIARPDGRVLLTLFASTLVRHDLSPPWNGQRSWPASGHALRAIYEALTPKPTLAECQQVAGIAGVPSNRTTIEYATYLITSAVLDADPREVWAWYRELLLKNDDDLCWQAKSCHRRAVCYVSLAERLGQLPDPFGEWRSVWKALFVTDRERARFATLDQMRCIPAFISSVSGYELLRHAPSRSGAWKFLEEILDCTRILLEGYARRFNPIKPEVVLDVLDVACAFRRRLAHGRRELPHASCQRHEPYLRRSGSSRRRSVVR